MISPLSQSEKSLLFVLRMSISQLAGGANWPCITVNSLLTLPNS